MNSLPLHFRWTWKIRTETTFIYKKAKVSYSRIFYPNGKCYFVEVPPKHVDKDFVGLFFTVRGISSYSNATIFRVHLTDKNNNAELFLPTFQMEGDEISINSDELGYPQFRKQQ